MAIFEYKGHDSEGKPVTGTVIGPSMASVADDLSKRGVRVAHLGESSMPNDPLAEPARRVESPRTPEAPPRDPTLEARSRWMSEVVAPLVSPVPLSALLFFFRQLGSMVSAGVGVVQSLHTLSTQTPNATLRPIVAELKVHAEQGRPISVGLERYPEVFPPVMLNLVRVGEETGTLDKALGLVAHYIEQEIELRNLYRRVTLYPKLVIGSSIVIILATNWIIGYFGKTGGIASPLTNPVTWLFLGPLLVLMFSFFRVGTKNREVRRTYDLLTSTMPYLGTTLRQLSMAKFGRAFGALYGAGVALPRAFQLAADACGNEYLRERMYPAVKQLENGESITEVFAGTGAFSPIVLDMTRTGETTGNLDQMLLKLADYYEDDSKTRAIQMGYVLGVIALLIVAVYVAYVVITFWVGYATGAVSGA
ncbi:MAG: type II secretion system F family protein [Fimbriimonadaceae bacterium]|nr:type II secretion system F family protein [Fimbriimonadaceae bacterium]